MQFKKQQLELDMKQETGKPGVLHYMGLQRWTGLNN